MQSNFPDVADEIKNAVVILHTSNYISVSVLFTKVFSLLKEVTLRASSEPIFQDNSATPDVSVVTSLVCKLDGIVHV